MPLLANIALLVLDEYLMAPWKPGRDDVHQRSSQLPAQHGSFAVAVADRTPPILVLPAAVSADAPSPRGAVVNYGASAVDAVDGPVTASCTPVARTCIVRSAVFAIPPGCPDGGWIGQTLLGWRRQTALQIGLDVRRCR
ncbi:hypothetical protein AB0J72_47740 [Dactylosporangium sp. NPDC049742]|uniref:hypothetical protein n=1 Tax=Dactylosporangium sp. NPDC049742 TaxID=3154737 RepID=UPI00342A4343